MKTRSLINIGLATLIAIAISLTLLSTTSLASYRIDESYAPPNTPFDFDFRAMGAEGSTIFLLQIIAGALLFFAAPLAVIMICWAAFDMVMGGADSEKLEQSKKHLTWSIIGLILIIISYSAVRFVLYFVITSAEPSSATPATTTVPATGGTSGSGGGTTSNP